MLKTEAGGNDGSGPPMRRTRCPGGGPPTRRDAYTPDRPALARASDRSDPTSCFGPGGPLESCRSSTAEGNHRKIAIVDGRVAFTGSQNLVASDFVAGITYEELVLRLTGPAVLELQYIFATDWFLETNEVLESENVFSRS